MPADSPTTGATESVGLRLAVARESEVPASAIDSLSPDERAYATGRLRVRRRRQFVGGRFLLRALLEHQTGQPPETHEIHVSEGGKPRCKSDIAISIAHTRDVIVCAATAAGEVGVDVERGDARRDWRRLARHHFSANESAWLETRPLEECYQHWVLKEAWLKMRGSGIAGGLGCLECRIAQSVIEAPCAHGNACHLSLFACHGAFIGLATDRAAHGSPLLLAWLKELGALAPANDLIWLASTARFGDRWIASAA